MDKIRLLADIDGVACDHAKAICKWVRLNHNIVALQSSVATWDHDFGPLTFVDAVKICYEQYDFVFNMPVNEQFLNFYKKMIGIIDITFATARNQSVEATKQWVEKYFPGATVIFTPQKALVANQDYLVDDYYKECILCAEKGMKSILLKRPWNCAQEIHDLIRGYAAITYCKSLDDLPTILNISE